MCVAQDTHLYPLLLLAWQIQVALILPPCPPNVCLRLHKVLPLRKSNRRRITKKKSNDDSDEDPPPETLATMPTLLKSPPDVMTDNIIQKARIMARKEMVPIMLCVFRRYLFVAHISVHALVVLISVMLFLVSTWLWWQQVLV